MRRTKRGRGDLGAVQVPVLVAALVVSLGAGTAGLITQRAVSGGDGSSDPVEVAASGRGAVVATDCEGTVALGEVHGGDRIFVTGISEDGDRLRIRNPLSPTQSWWIVDSTVDTDEDIDGLPSVSCDDPDEVFEEGDDEVAGPTDTTDDNTTTTDTTATTTTTAPDDDALQPPDVPGLPTVTQPGAVQSTPTTPGPAPTTPGPTPTSPPPPVDATGPSLSAAVSEAEIWEQHGGLCAGKPRDSTITAQVSDPSGVANVRATWSFVGTGGLVQESKFLSGGATRTGSVGPYAYGTLPSLSQKTMQITVTATDGVGNTSSRNVTVRLHNADQCFG